MDTQRISTGRTPASTGSGVRIFSMDVFKSSKPMSMMTMETPKPDMYSNRPWPKGWSASGFMPENRKPTRVINEEPASDRLLKASAVMAMEPLKTPARYFPIKSSTFRPIPTMLHSIP